MAAIAIISLAPLIVSAVAKNLLVSNLTTVADDALSIMLRLRTANPTKTLASTNPDYSYTVPELKQLESDDIYEQIEIARSMLLDVKNVLISANACKSTAGSTNAPTVAPENVVHEICGYLAYPDEAGASLNVDTSLTLNAGASLNLNTAGAANCDWNVDYTTASASDVPICRTLLLALTNIQSSLHAFYQTLFTIQHKREMHQQKWFAQYRSLDVHQELTKLVANRARIQSRLDTFFQILKFQHWYQQLAGYNKYTAAQHNPNGNHSSIHSYY